jgi:hypothetical protein
MWEYEHFRIDPDCWTLTERKDDVNWKLDAIEMRFLSAMSGHRLMGPRRNEDITEELQNFDTN